MSEWFAFIIAVGEETITWLGSMQLLGVSLAGIIVGFFVIGVMFKILYRP